MNYPPRLMKKSTAAAYCDMSDAAFDRAVSAGHIPMPLQLGKIKYWHRPAIDAALDALAGLDNDWRKESPLYAQG